MNKLFIDIDNKAPGAIVQQIVEYVLPKCSLDERGISSREVLGGINKYYNKTLKMISECQVEKIEGRLLCKKHSPDYADMKIIQNRIGAARVVFGRGRAETWLHFNTMQQADMAQEYVKKYFAIKGRCCFDKGLWVGR